MVEEKILKFGGITGDIDKLEIVNYSVVAQDYYLNRKGNGFILNEEIRNYYITGTLKNKSEHYLYDVKIETKLYDSKGIFLDSELHNIGNIPSTYSQDFQIWIYVGLWADNVDRVEFKLIAGRKKTSPEENPLEVTKLRYAKGEITKEEFEEMKKDIES